LTFQSYFAPDGVSGVLGVGPNAGGPGPSIPTQALPGSFGQGILIDETAASPYIRFGSLPSDIGPSLTTISGAPIPNGGLTVAVTHAGTVTTHPGVGSIIDSGGVEGTLPAGLNAQPGDTITVYAPGNTPGDVPLYSYTYNGNYFPTPISSGLMNTGNLLFQHHAVYIDYGANTQTIF
jgi:hypothetical protein